MKKTDEQVNKTAYRASLSQYGSVHHEEYESTANGFIMGYNDAVNDMELENDRLKLQIVKDEVRSQKSVVDWFWVGLIIGVFLTTLFFVL